MRSALTYILLSAVLLMSLNGPVKAQDILLERSLEHSQDKQGAVIIPFAFYLQTLGVAAAVDVAARGLLQPQDVSNVVLMYSTNGSAYLYGEMFYLQIPGIERLFVNTFVDLAHYGALDLYSGPNPEFGGQWAGRNDSHKDNYFRIKSNSAAMQLQGKWLLPVGLGRDQIISTIELDRGIPVSGFTGGHGPVLFNGRTFLETTMFYRNQDLKLPMGKQNLTTAGYATGLLMENVDFRENPSRGSTLEARYTKGTKAFNSTVPWQMAEASYSRFFTLPEGIRRQRVLALSAWSAYVSSWDDYTVNETEIMPHRPSPFLGASLGGRFRFRAYPEARFSDKATLYYAAEYRFIPHFNPLANWDFVQRIGVRNDWIQWVFFAEAGRVAPSWQLRMLHEDLKYSAGAGFRLFANQMVVRVDAGVCNEGAQVQMFINQAF